MYRKGAFRRNGKRNTRSHSEERMLNRRPPAVAQSNDSIFREVRKNCEANVAKELYAVANAQSFTTKSQ